MKDFFRYLPTGPEMVAWGAAVTAAGFTRIAPGSTYPPAPHPSGHDFTWHRGRVLQDYQVIWITEGSGTFESNASGLREVLAGDVILLFPGVWHRYSPSPAQGWTESWIELSGATLDALRRKRVITPERPVLRVGHPPELAAQFERARELVEAMPAGAQPMLAMLGMQVLATVLASVDLPSTEATAGAAVRRAQVLMRESLDRPIVVEALARRLGVSYTTFRRAFRRQTGLSPKQYHLDLRLRRARERLRDTDLTLEAIAGELGFGSGFHLSATFRRHVGVAPATWRRDARGQAR